MNAAMQVSDARAAWLADRQHGIGGSDVAPILGMSKWRTPLDTYLDKIGEGEQQEENDAMAWGKRLESAVLDAYADATGHTLFRQHGIIGHAEHSFLRASLDAYTTGRVVEAKTARTAQGWGEPGSAEIPDAYALQVQHYMAISGHPLADVAVLIGGSDFRIYSLAFDAALYWDAVFPRLAEFWQRVQRREPPEPVSYADAVQRYGRSAIAGRVQASQAAIEAYGALCAAKARIAQAEIEAEDAKAVILRELGEHGDTLTSGDRVLATWKLAKAPNRFDAKAFAAAHPDLSAQFTVAGIPSRRFLLKELAA